MAGGPEELIPSLTSFNFPDIEWVGVDYGVIHLLNQKIIPSIAFGDFDSVTEYQLKEINQVTNEIKMFKPEKNETDLELALLWAIKQKPLKIRIFGATGGRADHFFANAMLLVRPECIGCNIEIIDKQNSIVVYLPGEYMIENRSDKKYISFVPLSEIVNDITLRGFKYPLMNKQTFMGSSLCISNELIQETGHFSFTSGILMMIRSHD
ncbi:thiamine diphosphokinase [Heyndrickxia vini]|uniref:Thiamine diphosphokinase n=1 Tax=Heyndrickxia vini TaxID=1476025 RepID=A0ABX7E881_9BACI|nr:thiamine diphosphokinase [Heyndrickxia vini]QQZ11533.1 thiamine diphosphokinase [Heyndrickxia vini]